MFPLMGKEPDNPSDVTRMVRVGINAFSPQTPNYEVIKPTLESLEKLLPDKVEVTIYSPEGMAQAIKDGRVDVVLTTSGFYRSMKEPPLSPLVTLMNPRAPSPNLSEGSAIIVRDDRYDLETIGDLKGKILLATSKDAFSGYLDAMGEISQRGYDYEDFFSKVKFIGHNYRNIIDGVLRGDGDAGVIGVCELEILGLRKDSGLRVIEPKQGSAMRCLHSTDLYPNWTIAITSNAQQSSAAKIVRNLLEMPPTSYGLQWSIATDFSQVDDLIKRLKIGPYSYLRQWTVRGILEKYWFIFVLLILSLAGVLIHTLILKKQINKRTAELSNALANLKTSEKRASEMLIRLEEAKRITSLGQFSNIVVHEVRQPLGAILLYLRGLRRLIEKPQLNTDLLALTTENMSAELKRVNSIIDKFSQYSKKPTNQMMMLDLGSVVREAAKELTISKRVPQQIRINCFASARVKGDPFQLKLAVQNIIQNASEAMADREDSSIDVYIKVDEENKKTFVCVEDEGESLSDRQLEDMEHVLMSKKSGGLGLGLAIVRSILELHRGSLSFTRLFPKGLCVCMELPLEEET